MLAVNIKLIISVPTLSARSDVKLIFFGEAHDTFGGARTLHWQGTVFYNEEKGAVMTLLHQICILFNKS